MFLPSKDGIICDHCGTTYKDQFVYYSTRTIKYQIINNRRSAPQNANFNTDMCEDCYNQLLAMVKKFVGKARRDKIKCDLSPAYKSGTFDYYILYFDKVDVDKDRGNENCVKSEKNVMDINVINGFDQMVQKTQVIRKKIEQEGMWA